MTNRTKSQRTYAEAAPMPAILTPPPERSRLGRSLRRHPTMWLGGVILVLAALMAVFAPLIAPADPTELNPAMRVRPPSATPRT